MDSAYLQGWRVHSLSGQALPVLSHPHSKKVFPDVQLEVLVLQFVPADSGPVTGPHGKELTFRCLCTLMRSRMSLFLSRLSSPSSLSLSSSPYIILVAHHWSLRISLVPRTGHSTPVVASSVPSREEGEPALVTGNTSPNAT